MNLNIHAVDLMLEVNTTTCTECIPGMYRNEDAPPGCLVCEVGTVASNIGSASCSSCPEGSTPVVYSITYNDTLYQWKGTHKYF
jgi:hypothetical protein